MATVRWEFTDQVLKEHAARGMLAEVAERFAVRTLMVLAKPDIGEHKVPLSFLRPDWTVGSTLWFDKWWAKLLRRADHGLRHWGWRFPRFDAWLSQYLAFGLRLPGWLSSLVHSQSVRVGLKPESLPVGAIERIAAMANYLRFHEKAEPSKVLVGCKAMLDLRESLCADYWPGTLMHFENPFGATVLGLEIQVSPFLAPDEILVV